MGRISTTFDRNELLLDTDQSHDAMARHELLALRRGENHANTRAGEHSQLERHLRDDIGREPTELPDEKGFVRNEATTETTKVRLHEGTDRLHLYQEADSGRGSGDLTSANTANVQANTAIATGTGADSLAAFSTSAVAQSSESVPEQMAAAGGYPDASTTGVPAGTQLTAYNGTLNVTQDGAVISNMLITGRVLINANNVTFQNCKIVSQDDFSAVNVDGANFTMKDCEVDGGGRTANGINGYGTFLRNDIHGAENGINIAGPTVFKDNYIHDLDNINGSPHYDGIQLDGGHDVQILHNTIVNQHTQTAAVMIDNYWEGLSNITVDGNKMLGGCYALYVDGRFSGGYVDDASIRITNNQADNGYYGDFVFYGEDPVFYGNTDLNGNLHAGQDPDPNPDPDPTPIGVTITGTSGNDILPKTGQSNTGDETYLGLDGSDVLRGGNGADVLDGGNGTDAAYYDTSNAGVTVNLATGATSGGQAVGDKLISIEKLIGSSYNDAFTGNSGSNTLNSAAGADQLFGGAGNDAMAGGAGNDRLEGQAGIDTLAGNEGADSFIFRASGISGANADHISDFRAEDVLMFDVTSGTTGALSASNFVTGSQALDSGDHFIFDKGKGNLYYDADGNGSGGKVLVATFDNHYNVTAADISLF